MLLRILVSRLADSWMMHIATLRSINHLIWTRFCFIVAHSWLLTSSFPWGGSFVRCNCRIYDFLMIRRLLHRVELWQLTRVHSMSYLLHHVVSRTSLRSSLLTWCIWRSFFFFLDHGFRQLRVIRIQSIQISFSRLSISKVLLIVFLDVLRSEH